MSRPVTFQVESGQSFVAEVEDPIKVYRTVGGPGSLTELITEPIKTLEVAIRNVEQATEALVDRLHSLSSKPNEVSVECGVKLRAESGAINAVVSTNPDFPIVFKWKRTPASGA